MCLSTIFDLQEWSQTQNLISYIADSAKFSQCPTPHTFSQNLAVHGSAMKNLDWNISFLEIFPFAGASCAYVFPTCEAYWCDAYDWSRRAGWQNHCSPCWWSRVQRIQWHQRVAKAQTHGNQEVRFCIANLTVQIDLSCMCYKFSTITFFCWLDLKVFAHSSLDKACTFSSKLFPVEVLT